MGLRIDEAGQVAAITGAASGLGLSLALRLARHGWRIALADLDGSRLGRGVESVMEAGGEAFALATDVSAPESVRALAEAVFERWGRCDLLVNNAGMGVGGLVGEARLDDWRLCLETNLLGPVYGCHFFVPRMKGQGRGYIVNVASAAAFACPPGLGPYSTAKAGLVALSATLGAELRGTGLGVSVVCPTFFKSRLHRSLRAPEGTSTEAVARLIGEASVSADQVADAVLAAVSRGRFYVMPRPEARLLWWLHRLSPASAMWLASRLARRLGTDSPDAESTFSA